MTTPEFCIIFNPASGRGRSKRRLEGLRRALDSRAAFWPTERAGHAEELARRAALEGFPIVAAAGGDGTVHEVANGLLRSRSPTVTLAVFPVGSANDYAHSLGIDADWWRRPDPALCILQADVGVVRAPTGRERFFVNGLGLGFNGSVTLESRRIKNLQGLSLYGLAALRAMWSRYTHPPMNIRLDDSVMQQVPTLLLTLALGRREGNFILAPDAKIDDGLFDYLHVGALSRLALLRYMPGLLVGRLPTGHPALRTGRCSRAGVESKGPLTVHVDGEFFCLPEDEVCSLEVEIIPGGLRVLGRATPGHS